MVVSIDFETCLIDENTPSPDPVSLAIGTTEDLSGVTLYHANLDPQTPRVLYQVFQQAPIVIGFNIPFDIFVATRKWPELYPIIEQAYDQGRVVDIGLRDTLLEIANGDYGTHKVFNNLGQLGKKYGIEIDKNDEWRLRYGELIDTPISCWPRPAVRYASWDVAHPLKIFRLQNEQDPTNSILFDAPHQSRAALALYDQHPITGMRTDFAQVGAMERKLQQQVWGLQNELLHTGLLSWAKKAGQPYLKRNQKEAKRLLVEFATQTGQLDRIVETKTGPSLSQEALGEFDMEGDHPIVKFRELGSRQVLLSKLEPYKSPVVRASYSPLLATGRVSQGSPNLMNQPKEEGFRECFIPRDGFVYGVTDWAAVELCTLAQICLDEIGWSRLAELINSGVDPHVGTAISIDPSLSFATFDKKIAHHNDMRQLAKAANFGFPGMLGPAKFMTYAKNNYGVKGLTIERSRHVKRSWQNALPEMRSYQKWVESKRVSKDYYRIVQPRSGRVRMALGLNAAANTSFQGLQGDVSKLAMWWLFKAKHDPKTPFYGCQPVLFVHDEIVTEMPIDRAEEALAFQDHIMIAALRHYCPDIKGKVESHTMDRYKKA